jgi:DNA mismatch endonuclease, patch repair protein
MPTNSGTCNGFRPYKRVEKRLAADRIPTTLPADSKRMSGVRQHATSAELVVRKTARGLGLRYTTENRDLAGSPDLANRSRKWAVFVHGCFWHRHVACPRSTMPKRNAAFWSNKFARNVERDVRVRRALRQLGFCVVVIWECETKDLPKIRRRLSRPQFSARHSN